MIFSDSLIILKRKYNIFSLVYNCNKENLCNTKGNVTIFALLFLS